MNNAYILAGGKSIRFGTSKALVTIDGQPLVRKLSLELSGTGWDVSVVAQSEEQYVGLGLRCIRDRIQDSGPLIGLATALQDGLDRKQEWCLVATCDLVRWDPDWGQLLVAGLNRIRNDQLNHRIVRFESTDFLPFPALYRTDSLSLIDSLWSEGFRSVRSFHDAIPSQILRIQAPDSGLPKSFNTQEELTRLTNNQDS